MSTTPKPLFDMSKAVPIASAKPLFDMSKAQPIPPLPLDSAETGVWAGVKRNTVGVVSGLFHALADPATDQEKAELLQKVRAENAQGGNVPESLATDPSTATLAYHRLVDAPASQLAQKGSDERAAAQDLLRQGKTWAGANLYASGATDAALAAVPLAGPLINNIAQRYESGDHSGAATDVAALVALSKVPDAVEALPSKARAGAAFQKLSGELGTHPVEVTDDLSKSLTEIKDWQAKGNTLPQWVNRLYTRLVTPDAPQLSFDEARGFQQTAGARASVMERTRTTANTMRLAANVADALNDAIEDTANRAGKLQDFRDAMGEYKHAAQLGTAAKVAAIGTAGALVAKPLVRAGYSYLADLF